VASVDVETEAERMAAIVATRWGAHSSNVSIGFDSLKTVIMQWLPPPPPTKDGSHTKTKSYCAEAIARTADSNYAAASKARVLGLAPADGAASPLKWVQIEQMEGEPYYYNLADYSVTFTKPDADDSITKWKDPFLPKKVGKVLAKVLYSNSNDAKAILDKFITKGLGMGSEMVPPEAHGVILGLTKAMEDSLHQFSQVQVLLPGKVGITVDLDNFLTFRHIPFGKVQKTIEAAAAGGDGDGDGGDK